MSSLIDSIEKEQLKPSIPNFRAGDNVKVHVRVVEGNKERIQVFEGLVISVRNSGPRYSFTVRKISHGIGVERSFLAHSPKVEKIDVIRRGDVRRAKLYYIREKIGRAARIKELRTEK